MFSTHAASELVERPSDYNDPTEVDLEHTKSSLLPNQTLLDDIAEASLPTPQTLSGVPLVPLCIQILLTILPWLYIALATAAISLDRKPVSPTGKTVQEAITVSPTIFPIIFAAIIGKFFRALGSFGVERGIKLGTLERLIGSQSLFTAVERQIALRNQCLVGLPIILLWALSPLGGQSALRLLQISPKLVSTDASVRYLPIAAGSAMTAFSGDSGALIGWSSFASIYMTALTTTRRQQNSSQDLFGNVRIPSYDSLTPALIDQNQSWMTIDHNANIHYSAMLGIPVVGIPTAGDLTFNIISRYYAIDCKNSTVVQDGEGDSSQFLTDFSRASNSSNGWLTLNSPNGPNGSNVSLVNCSLAPRNVESIVSCSDQSCQVNAMRNLPVNVDDLPSEIRISVDYLANATLGPRQRGSRMTSSLTEMWLQDPYSVYVAEAFGQFANLSQIPLQNLSRNLETLYNTYWQSSFGARYLFGNLSTNMSLYDNISISRSISFNTSQTTITSPNGDQYICDMTFAALLLIISCLLFLAGIATLVLMKMTLAPDIIGYMSSYTRDNPFASVDQASYLDGLERARALNDVHITLGDVNIRSETGHIAFSVAAEVQRLRKDRFYD